MANESIQVKLEQSLDQVKLQLKLDTYEIVFGDMKPSLNLQEIKVQIKDTKARSNRIQFQAALMEELQRAHPDFIVKELKDSPEAIKPIEFTDRNKGNDGKPRLEGRRIFMKPLGRATPVTEFSESLVAYACSIYQELGGDIEQGDLITKNLPAAKNVLAENKGTKLTLNQCIGALNDEWWKSSVAIANALMGSNHVDSSMTYSFHRGDMFMDNIYKKAKEVLKAGDDSGKFASMDMNKWNPSDIWLSSTKVTKQTINEEVSKMKGGIQEFNAMLTRLRKEKKLIGVSLKKTEGATAKVDLVKNESSSLAERGLDLVYVGPTASKSKFQKSIVIQFKLDGNLGDMQFRNFSSTPKRNGFQGNITGLQGQSAAAVHGKVGVWRIFIDETGAPKRFKQTYGMVVEAKNLPKINSDWEDAMRNNGWIPEMTLFKTIYNKVNGKSHDNMYFITKWSAAKSYDFCSNLLALQVTEQVESFMSDKVKKEFMSNIVLYAMSQIPGISSTFLKNK